MIFRKVAGQEPECFTHHVGADGVGIFFDTVETLFVQILAFALAPEQPGAQSSDGGGHDKTTLHGATGKGDFTQKFLSAAVIQSLHLDIFQPEPEPAQNRPSIKSPLGDEVSFIPECGIRHGRSLRSCSGIVLRYIA